jgi:hypothetical protein
MTIIPADSESKSPSILAKILHNSLTSDDAPAKEINTGGNPLEYARSGSGDDTARECILSGDQNLHAQCEDLLANVPVSEKRLEVFRF